MKKEKYKRLRETRVRNRLMLTKQYSFLIVDGERKC
jgi:hypothetical protein